MTRYSLYAPDVRRVASGGSLTCACVFSLLVTSSLRIRADAIRSAVRPDDDAPAPTSTSAHAELAAPDTTPRADSSDGDSDDDGAVDERAARDAHPSAGDRAGVDARVARGAGGVAPGRRAGERAVHEPG